MRGVGVTLTTVVIVPISFAVFETASSVTPSSCSKSTGIACISHIQLVESTCFEMNNRSTPRSRLLFVMMRKLSRRIKCTSSHSSLLSDFRLTSPRWITFLKGSLSPRSTLTLFLNTSFSSNSNLARFAAVSAIL